LNPQLDKSDSKWFRLEPEGIDRLIQLLKNDSYQVIAPVEYQNTIDYCTIESATELPIGKSDQQQPGQYRLHTTDQKSFFGFNLGIGSWKKFLFPAREKIWESKKGDLVPKTQLPKVEKLAFLGVRACELAAIGIHDRVLLGQEYSDKRYASRRQSVLIIAVNCNTSASTCFCASMATGPRVKDGFDIEISEFYHSTQHYFLIRGATQAGKILVDSLDLDAAEQNAEELVAAQSERVANSQTRQIPQSKIRDELIAASQSPVWDEIADRCLSCANCTMACPTCFCTGVQDVTDLTGEHSERWRTWDSCFNLDYSYIHGGSVRKSTASRYRQWITHKLATWHDQFGESGCVGCGRCVTWCPVGIDITEEAGRLRLSIQTSTEGKDA
jgi:sulfhydrogenase subunit beta (sulfur reductase)